MITVPIRITLSSRPVVLPRDQNAALIRFACPTCGQHLSATPDQIGMTAPCPNCNGVVTVPIQSTLPPRPLPLSEPEKPRTIAAWGLGLQVIGMLLCWTVYCSRCNRWHSTFHRWQTHGERNVYLPLRE